MNRTKANTAALVLLILAYGILSAVELDLTLEPSVTVLNGGISEYVFDQSCLNTDNMESRLDWDISSIGVFGAEAELCAFRHLVMGAAGKIAVPEKSGLMQDYDWLNSTGGPDGSLTEWKNEDPTELTNYSRHNNRLEKYYSLEFRLGGRIQARPLGQKLLITPFASYNYELISFSADSGYYIYKAYNFDPIDTRDKKKVISYTQEYNAVFFGLELALELEKPLLLRGEFSVSPCLTFLGSYDFHYLTRAVYYDKIDNAFQLKACLSAAYRMTRRGSVALTARLDYMPLKRGISYQNSIDSKGDIAGSWYLSTGESGSKKLLWSAGISFQLSL